MENKLQTDESILQKMGYKQELKRNWSLFQNFCLCFSVMSLFVGITPLYGTALITGGPVVIMFGWIYVTFMTFIVALSMAEVCSAYPTSGGVYYWVAALSKPNHTAIVSFFAGWFNLIGYLTGYASTNFGLSMLLTSTITVATDGNWVPTPPAIVFIYIGIIIVQGLISTFANRIISTMMMVSTKFVFTDFENHTGWASNSYVVLLGLLQSQFSLTGYDSAAHMAEETQNAQKGGPISILSSILATAVIGFIFLLSVTCSIQDYDRVINSSSIPIAQVFLDALGKSGAVLCLCILMGGIFFCGNSVVTSTSRLIYAMSRDGALPFSEILHKPSPKSKTPVTAVWALALITALMGLLYLGSATALLAITSVCTISLNITYGIPTLCLIFGRKNFVPGPFTLGKWSQCNGIIALVWISFISVLFILPTQAPVTASNMNYAIAIFECESVQSAQANDCNESEKITDAGDHSVDGEQDHLYRV
ncbi:APC amino acid permease [Umbelopsis sp. PMI_123]|nr:APC amino acid permease [Umbelopsis sp. PMI_123]